MMTDDRLIAGPSSGDFLIGHVLTQTWSVLTRNFFKLCLVTGVMVLPFLLFPLILPASLMALMGAGPIRITAFSQLGIDLYTFLTWAAVFFVVMMVVFNFCQAAVFYMAVEHMRHRPVSLIDGLRVAAGRLPSLMVVGLLFFVIFIGLGILGSLFIGGLAAVTAMPPFVPVLLSIGLFVAYVMLMITLLVATPACVVERLGPVRSFGRSRELTKGHRWKILGLLLLTLILLIVVLAVAGVLIGVGIAFSGAIFLGPVVGQAIGLAWDAIFVAFFAVFIAAVYRDLRIAKEGVDTDQISTVFE